jgi:hypothetical protein
VTDDELRPEDLAAEATRTMERLQEAAVWLVEWARDPEPEIRLRESGTIDDVFELVKGLADLGTLLATQVGQALGWSAEDVLQQVAGAANDPSLARVVAEQWRAEGPA